jgi:hypothetical protein
MDADLVVVGIGVRRRSDLRNRRGLWWNFWDLRGRRRRTLARSTHRAEGSREHWVVAERQGQTAACNMMGGNEPFDAVPFLWSAHYDTQVLYVGHAETWDTLQIDGSVEARDCRVAFRNAGRTLAVATIVRDLDSLRAELELEAVGPAQ